MFKEYFSFTLKERIAIITLVLLILGIYLLPQFLEPDFKKPGAEELAAFRKAERELLEQSKNPDVDRSADLRGNGMDHAPPFAGDESKPARLFYFDPNTLDAAGWQQLGLRPKTIGTIQKYLAKGGRFKEAEDLQKIFGLRPDDYRRIRSYIRIPPATGDNKKFFDNGQASEGKVNPDRPTTFTVREPRKKWEVIDINMADSTMLIALPGIGSKLAARIISFRQKLGGFYSVDQVGETYGLPDSTFQTIRPWLSANAAAVQKININAATVDQLKQHPYVKWNLAAALIRYREQHGAFRSLPELQQIGNWTEGAYQKLLPYLALE